MKSIVTSVALILFSSVAFCQSSAQTQEAKQSTNKQSAKTTTVTNSNKQTSTDRVGNPNTGTKTWYYCQVCGQKYSASGKCPTDGTTLVAKTVK